MRTFGSLTLNSNALHFEILPVQSIYAFSWILGTRDAHSARARTSSERVLLEHIALMCDARAHRHTWNACV